jgi:imidazole glycerol phosphate synthase subunit HisF
MNTLQAVAQEYQKRAEHIVAAHTDKEGNFDASCQQDVDFNRDAAAAVLKLIPPVPVEVTAVVGGTVWNLDDEKKAIAFSDDKVTTRDKAATPQELLEKAK